MNATNPQEIRRIAAEAYIFGVPMVEMYKTMYVFSVAKDNPQYRGPFNAILNNARVFTPMDTAFVTPNSDTPYTFASLDLRAEPMVLTIPKIEKERYFVFQMLDLYTFNFDYIGTRVTGNDGGDFLFVGPDWKGDVTNVVTKVLRPETQFVNLVGRTQLFNPQDLENVKRIQAGYELQPLSAYLGLPALRAAPAPDWPKPVRPAEERTSPEFFNVLAFMLQFALPPHPSEVELRERFATIGIEPGKPFKHAAMPPETVAALAAGMADGQEQIDARRASLGGKSDTLFGDRAFLKNDYVARATGTQVGIGANSRDEALYPILDQDSVGKPLDGSKSQYELRFEKDELPPVNAFWSITMYDLPGQLLVENEINRYLINSPMLPNLKTRADGGLSIYVQADSPGKGKESNWLPAPRGPFMIALRYYMPKPEVLDGRWRTPALHETAAVGAAVTSAAASAVTPAGAQAQAAPLDQRTITDAYVYLLGRVLVIRQEHIDRNATGFAYNQIKYNPLGTADFVNPNFDVAYLEAWVAVDDESVAILEVPEIRGRYYTAQTLDEWGEVIANINERRFPTKPFGRFAFVTPGSTVKIPPDAARIELHGSKAKLLGRVELKGDADGAVRLQKQFKLTVTTEPKISEPPATPMFNNKDLIGVEIFDDVDAKLASALDVAPNAAELQQTVRAVAAYVASSPAARSEVDRLLRDKVIREFEEFAMTKSAPKRNHWVGAAHAGNYGGDFWLRTSLNYAGIWGNSWDEVIYFVATCDSQEHTLNGNNSYLMHFSADHLPQSAVDSYWSVILVGVPDYRVVENPLKRYNLNSYSPLRSEADGSLKIAIGPKAVGDVPASNWLPAPWGKEFALTFRTYVPKEMVRRGEWAPPAVTLVQ